MLLLLTKVNISSQIHRKIKLLESSTTTYDFYFILTMGDNIDY